MESLPVELTVEEYLVRECNYLIDEIKVLATHQTKKLEEEYTKRKELFLEEVCQVEQTLNEQLKKTSTALHVVLNVTEGIYKGKTFDIIIDHDQPCFIGRSRSKKFMKPGRSITLYKDKEVSTAHSKIEMIEGILFYVDVGSTNGTLWNNNPINADEKIKLVKNDTLRIGTNLITISSIS